MDNIIRHFAADKNGSSSSSSSSSSSDEDVRVFQDTVSGAGNNNHIRKYCFEKKRIAPFGSKRVFGKKTSHGYVTIKIVNVDWILDCISNYQIMSMEDAKYTGVFKFE